MVKPKTILIYMISTIIILIILAYLDIVDPQTAIMIFLLLLIFLAYLRREVKLPYRELTDNIF
jgi:hypothetical protein